MTTGVKYNEQEQSVTNHIRMHLFSVNYYRYCLFHEDHDPHLLGVLNLTAMSGNNVVELSVCPCRFKSQILPREMSTELN